MDRLAPGLIPVALLALTLVALGCDDPAAAQTVPSPAPSAALPPAAAPSFLGPPVPAPAPPPAACRAPSKRLRSRLDARTDDALLPCERLERPRAKGCGEGPGQVILDRLDEAVMAIDPRTRAHVERIVARGRALQRRPDAFGLVGDSMTVSGAFFPFDDPDPPTIASDVAKRLRIDEGSILDVFRGAEVVRVRGMWRDSFGAPRAARIGAPAPWALKGGEHGPLGRMVRTLSPATAFVLYGGNDAAARQLSIETMRADFRRDLEAIVDQLEAEGVVPILHTLARHADAPGIRNCGMPGEHHDWRITVATNAMSAAAIDVACDRALPLIDLRWAMDAADQAGLSADGIHPSFYEGGAGTLDRHALRCGYNVRNYVSLRMLAALWPQLRP